MKKHLNTIVLLCLTPLTNYCMDNSLWLPQNVCTRTRTTLRKKLDNVSTSADIYCIDPSIGTVLLPSPSLRYGPCHTYALSKILGILGKVHKKLRIIGSSDWYTQYTILDYFTPTQTPQNGDLIIYKKSPQSTQILHSGIVRDNNIVESKWGICPFICIHATHHAPYGYGNYVEYYRPRLSNKEILDNLHKKIKKDTHLLHHKTIIKKNLIQCARAEKNTFYLYKNHYHTAHDMISYFLEYNLCCSVNTKNKNDETLLMLAIIADNYNAVKMLLEYGAHIELKSKNGHTALDLAFQKGNNAIIALLLDFY